MRATRYRGGGLPSLAAHLWHRSRAPPSPWPELSPGPRAAPARAGPAGVRVRKAGAPRHAQIHVQRIPVQPASTRTELDGRELPGTRLRQRRNARSGKAEDIPARELHHDAPRPAIVGHGDGALPRPARTPLTRPGARDLCENLRLRCPRSTSHDTPSSTSADKSLFTFSGTALHSLPPAASSAA